jgi:G3E family GTPase
VIEGLEHLESMVELDSGCVCCSIDDASLDLALGELVERAVPTLIVLETTGAADPAPVCERLARAGLPCDAVITVVDAANVERAMRETAVARAQIQAADFVVLNKTDLVTKEQGSRVRRRLKRLNRRALVLEAERGKVQADLLFATSVRTYRRAEGSGVERAFPASSGEGGQGPHTAAAPAGGHGHGEERIDAFSWRGQGTLDRKRFERFLADLPPAIYRAKGFVRFSDHDWSCLFNYTCGRYELNWIQLGDSAAPVQAVFIGQGTEHVREPIVRALEACRTR